MRLAVRLTMNMCKLMSRRGYNMLILALRCVLRYVARVMSSLDSLTKLYALKMEIDTQESYGKI